MNHTVMGNEEWVIKTFDHHSSLIAHPSTGVPALPA